MVSLHRFIVFYLKFDRYYFIVLKKHCVSTILLCNIWPMFISKRTIWYKWLGLSFHFPFLFQICAQILHITLVLWCSNVTNWGAPKQVPGRGYFWVNSCYLHLNPYWYNKNVMFNHYDLFFYNYLQSTYISDSITFNFSMWQEILCLPWSSSPHLSGSNASHHLLFTIETIIILVTSDFFFLKWQWSFFVEFFNPYPTWSDP